MSIIQLSQPWSALDALLCLAMILFCNACRYSLLGIGMDKWRNDSVVVDTFLHSRHCTCPMSLPSNKSLIILEKRGGFVIELVAREDLSFFVCGFGKESSASEKCNVDSRSLLLMKLSHVSKESIDSSPLAVFVDELLTLFEIRKQVYLIAE